MKKLVVKPDGFTVKTKHGEFVVSYMDDGVSDYLEIVYHDGNNHECVVAMDVLKDTDEARALVYPVDCDEPTDCIVLN